MKRPLWIIPVLALALAGCAAQPTPYEAQDGHSTGYDQQQIDSQTWRVEFAGNAATPRETVDNYLLYRAAEIMRFGGYNRFVVLEKEIERDVDYHGFGPYPGHIGVGVGHHRGHFGYGVGAYDYYQVSRYRAFATVRVYTGGPPPAGLQVYDAADVISQLGPTIRVAERSGS